MSKSIKAPEHDAIFSDVNKRKEKIQNLGRVEFRMMQPYLKNFRTCLDIGANIGITTLRFAKHFENVHSFEPLTYKFLVENTKDLPNVKTHECAVSNKDGTIEIYPNPKNSMLGIIPDKFNKRFIEKRYTGKNADFKNTETVPVKCVTIDSFNFNDVDLIKIDVEGHILPVVKGMIQTLTNNSPIVQVEMFDVPDFIKMNQEVHNIFQKLGYVVVDTYSKGHQRDRFYYKE